jgi:hypothetical protein
LHIVRLPLETRDSPVPESHEQSIGTSHESKLYLQGPFHQRIGKMRLDPVTAWWQIFRLERAVRAREHLDLAVRATYFDLCSGKRDEPVF